MTVFHWIALKCIDIAVVLFIIGENCAGIWFVGPTLEGWFTYLSRFFYYALYDWPTNTIWVDPYCLYDRFEHIQAWVDTLLKQIASFLDWDTIVSNIFAWLPDLEDIAEWWTDLTKNITGVIDTWWKTTTKTVTGWIDVARETALSAVASVSAMATTLQAEWDDFWTTTFPTLATNLNVVSLIDSTLKTWFPHYDTEAEQEPTRISFFKSPLDWLLDKFTDWFLGTEV